MTDLNKKYSRYDGTEVVCRVLCPSKSSKYMFKNSEVCRNRATAGSGINYESSYARFGIEKLSKGWHIDQNIVISTSSWLKNLRTGFVDT